MSNPVAEQQRQLILVVADDPAMRMLMRETLGQAGFEVVDAANGAMALAVITERRPDLIIMDVEMPGMDGFALCKKVRIIPVARHTPIVMIAGRDDAESVNRAYELGATDVIVKPISWAVLAHRVKYMLRSSSMFRNLRESETRLATAQRIARLGNWEWEVASDHMYWSEEVRRTLGIRSQESPPTLEAFLSCINPDDRKRVQASLDAALKGRVEYNVEYRVHRQDATERHVHAQGEVVFDNNGLPRKMQGTIQDITDRKLADERILRLAYYDTLTSLPNRQFLLERMVHRLAEAKRHKQPFGVLIVDLDNFKRINDSLGPTVGDGLLNEVANRLMACIRESDYLVPPEISGENISIARFGGDEFTILLPEIAREEDAAVVARRIMEGVTKPYLIENNELYISASIGISVYPRDGDTVDVLLKHADTAMYKAKEAGRNSFKFFDSSMNTKLMARLSMERRLRSAVEREQLSLHYQPKVDIRTWNIVGVEALLRWHDQELGQVSPMDFVPLAEDTGLIVPIGEWVIRTACMQNREWEKAGLPPLTVAVNLSSHQFRRGNLARVVEMALRESGLDPSRLELEITESILMQDTQETVRVLREFNEQGIVLSLDDFGTGYSSLSYLKRFPLDVLKIDRSFIRDIHRDPDDAAITRAIIAMASSLDLKVIGEGVETAAQLGFLIDNGCQEVQGYLFSKPVSSIDLVAWLAQTEAQFKLIRVDQLRKSDWSI